MPAAGHHLASADKIKGQSPEADPLRVRVPEGAASRDPHAGVSGASSVPPAAVRRGEGQRARLQGRPRQGHGQAAPAAQGRDRPC